MVTRIKPHPYFSRDGADVVLELPVSIAEAALGAEVNVPDARRREGEAEDPGRARRTARRSGSRGKGAPKLKGGGHGDLKVKVTVVTPKHLTDAQKTALETFSAESSEDLRAHIG